LDLLIIINERHLRAVLREYVEHYNRARPHRSLELTPPIATALGIGPATPGRIVSRSILGGLHHEYERLAA
jgi:hypothetical protein